MDSVTLVGRTGWCRQDIRNPEVPSRESFLLLLGMTFGELARLPCYSPLPSSPSPSLVSELAVIIYL
jgi:hypothetical protein